MLRMCVLTVFSETDSLPAISGLDRFVGRCGSTRSSSGLNSSADGEGWWPAAWDAPCTTLVTSAR